MGATLTRLADSRRMNCHRGTSRIEQSSHIHHVLFRRSRYLTHRRQRSTPPTHRQSLPVTPSQSRDAHARPEAQFSVALDGFRRVESPANCEDARDHPRTRSSLLLGGWGIGLIPPIVVGVATVIREFVGPARLDAVSSGQTQSRSREDLRSRRDGMGWDGMGWDEYVSE